MQIPVTGQATYSPALRNEAPRPAAAATGRFEDLLKAITPEEASALDDAFGTARPPARTSDHRGRHLDVRA